MLLISDLKPLHTENHIQCLNIEGDVLLNGHIHLESHANLKRGIYPIIKYTGQLMDRGLYFSTNNTGRALMVQHDEKTKTVYVVTADVIFAPPTISVGEKEEG